jgi:hypothetical protein
MLDPWMDETSTPCTFDAATETAADWTDADWTDADRTEVLGATATWPASMRSSCGEWAAPTLFLTTEPVRTTLVLLAASV